MTSYHVVPPKDLIKHDTSDEEECVCGPEKEEVKREDDSIVWLVVHHSLDGRERNE